MPIGASGKNKLKPTVADSGLAENLHEAIAQHRQGRLDEADERYAAVLAAAPGHPQVLRLRGVLARQRGDHDLSLRLLTRCAEDAPGDATAANELALTCMAVGDLYRAECALRDALRIDAHSGRALANLGALLQRRGHLERAIEQYALYLALEPDDLELRCNLANTLMEAGRGDEALAAIDAALAAAPGHPLVLANKGAILCGLGLFDAAIDILDTAVDLEPADDMALINLAFACRRLDNPVRAAAALRTAVRVNPVNARAVADLAGIEVQLGDADSALARCADFLAKFPGERLVTAAHILALADAGRGEEASALQGLDELVTIVDIATPPGFADPSQFNAALVDFVSNHPTLLADPLRKSTTGGRQTGELHAEESAVMAAFTAAVRQAVECTVDRWRRLGFGDHPVMAYATDHWKLRTWGTVLSSGGYQAPHIHPLGWISGAYYAQLPADMSADGPEAGALEFGRPPDYVRVRTLPPLRRVAPAESRLVMFPSYCYHRTLPFIAARRRVSVAFDVVPLSL